MRHYRIYRVGADGHFASADNIECADDEAAIQRAQQAVDGQDIELWEQGRFVARFRKPGSVVPPRDVIDSSRLQPIFVTVARDRAADRGCTGGCDGAEDVGPPGEIRGGFSF